MAKFNPKITAYLVPYIIVGYDNKILIKVQHISYTMGTRALPDIYALAHAALRQVHIYQAKHGYPQ